MLTRSRPASASGCASSASFRAFVVRLIRGGVGSALMRATISTMSGRMSGSPPVSRMLVTPSSTATEITVISSSMLSRWSPGIQSAKSGGMQ